MTAVQDAASRREDSTPTVRPDSTVTFLPLSIVPERELTVVGNTDTDVFLALPAVGVVIIRALVAGRTIADAAADATALAGEPVDALDFVEALIDTGLVLAIDGERLDPTSATPTEPEPGQRSTWLTRLASGLFSRAAWTVYAAMTLLCSVAIAREPSLWPTFHDVLFHPNISLSLATMMVVSIALAAGHEAAHGLAARAVGIEARLTVARRHYVPVFEADLSGLWSVPRRRRYGPFLAGMAFDMVVLTACLMLRLATMNGWLHPPRLLVAFVGAIALRQVIGLLWQTVIFLRTDIYAVVVTALGCYQLQRITALTLRKWTRRLRPEERAELRGAHPADARAARWFAPVTIAGLAGVYAYLVMFLIPGVLFTERWVLGTLTTVSPRQPEFWQTLTIGTVIGMQLILPLGIFLWQRMRRVAFA